MYFYLFPSCSFLFFWDHLQCCVCVCVCVRARARAHTFLYCLLVYNSMGSFHKHDGRSTRHLAGEYTDEQTPA